uniref:CCHC-type domain-containing protein n=1 Tax=Sorghum bicolor TaxID=4558 RepID=C6JST8_SORBI
MTDFRWYKDSFLSKLYTLPDPNQDFWKEKYISGLPPLFAEKVRNSLRKEGEGSINYQNLDIGKITQKIQLIGAELCNDLKIKEQLKKQRAIGKKKLGEFCYQFGFQDPFESQRTRSHRDHKRNYDDNKKAKHPMRRRHKKKYDTGNVFKNFKKDHKANDLVCFNCGQKGHKSSNCFKSKVKQEIQALLESDSEDIKGRLGEILNHIQSDDSSEDNTEINCCENKECSCYEQGTSENESDENVLVLTDLEQFVLDTFDTVQDPEEKEIILEKFLSRVKNNKDKLVNEIQKKKYCSADEVFQRVEDLKKKNKQLSLDDLSKEYNFIKEELIDLKRRIQILELHKKNDHGEKLIEREPPDDELVGSIERYFKQKWYTELSYEFYDGHKFTYNTLLDSGADVNCIQQDIIPSRYFIKSTHKIHSAEGHLLKVNYKIPEVNICIENIRIKASFVLVENLKQDVILGTPFLSSIRPFMVTDEGIQFHLDGTKIEISFLSKPEK